MRLSAFGAARSAVAGDAVDALGRRVEALSPDLDDAAVNLAAQLARCEPGLGDDDRQALMLLVLCSMAAARQGSTRIPAADDASSKAWMAELTASVAGPEAGPLLVRAHALVRDGAAPTVIGGPGDARPLIADGGWLYQHRALMCERRLAGHVASLLARGEVVPGVDCAEIDRAVADVIARPPVRGGKPQKHSAEQRAALEASVARPFTVITGGPGTGKTAIIVSILRVLARAGVAPASIALAAPTGKAAQRMRSSIATSLEQIAAPELFDARLLKELPTPRTLHRLLGYSPRADRFRYHENNRLAESVVIVDEGSMIDVFLMERLLRSLRDDARLILLGDADQLPSVDAGAVLRDLVPAIGGAAVKLTRSYRMRDDDPAGRAILEVAALINGGRARKLVADGGPLRPRATPDDLAYEGVELLATTGALAFADAWYAARVAGGPELDRLRTRVYRLRGGAFVADDLPDLRALLAHLESARVLTATRSAAAAINRRLHAAALSRATTDTRPDFYPGEAVIARDNDYQRGVFNGDHGVIARVAEDDGAHHYRAVFPRADGSYGVFHLDAMRHQIELAYAMTVHKSQGSELDHVALVLPPSDLPLLTRELLYTAVTRARRSVTVVGDRDILAAGTARRAQRFSGLVDLLAAL